MNKHTTGTGMSCIKGCCAAVGTWEYIKKNNNIHIIHVPARGFYLQTLIW